MAFQLKTGVKHYNMDQETLVMGILNVTPDSFSDGGHYNRVDEAVVQALKLEEAGAHIIDVGGESTRPGHKPVGVQEELKRVLPVIEAISHKLLIPISIDTYKSQVARQAVQSGASIINDVWGAKKDPAIASVAADLQVPIILMHNRDNKQYHALIADMLADLRESIHIAQQAGVHDDQIILDPGIGFAKTPEDNITVMRHLERFSELGFPILLGSSRKSFIGQILDLPVDERVEGTGATVCFGMTKGVHIVRVHDVGPIARMTKMMDAMLGKGV
ncbi:dihydropteroate synthase [Thalassobacillus sp. CUG 92003]|uniref:dihydropteroate synthase n=1 Tax=Thalassobacillus sp. CUG 92003 TaxID=2736641 RepID=UPI0015E6316B|nr:dihydropteroate synthase [Thalassobacillus sp. CUG 92003]